MSASLASYWHPIGTVEEVTDQPAQFVLLGERIVAFRDAQGVAAFKDVCIHRGTALSLGSVTDGRLTCAYHGWQYDRTGACTLIPALPPGSTIPTKARALAHRTTEAYGLVWVAMQEPVAPVPHWPKDEWHDARYRGFLACRYRWNSSAGRTVENFMDVSHFPFVHTNILGTLDNTVVVPHEVAEGNGELSYHYEAEEPGELHSAQGELVRWEYTLTGPFTIHLKKIVPSGRETIISLVSAPRTATTTDMYVFVVRNYNLEPAHDASFAEFTDRIMGQDQRIVESQRPEEIPVSLREELHLRVPDASGIAYRRLLGRIDQITPFLP